VRVLVIPEDFRNDQQSDARVANIVGAHQLLVNRAGRRVDHPLDPAQQVGLA